MRYKVTVTGEPEQGPDATTDEVTVVVEATHDRDAVQKARMVIARVRNDLVEGLATFTVTAA